MNKTIIKGIDANTCEWRTGIEHCGDYECMLNKCCDLNCDWYKRRKLEQLLQAKEQEIKEIKKYLGISDKTIIQRLEELQERRDKLSEENEKLKSQIENKKQALQIDIDNLNQACLDLSQENEELNLQTIEAATQLAPFQDEYFKGLDTKAIAELAKKSQRLTSENRELEQKNEELKAQVDEWKENCNNNFELVAIRTKLLTDIAIKLGLNTAIIERKDVFNKIDKLQSKEQLSLKQSQVIITLRNNLNVNKQKNANLLQENEELKKQLDKYLDQEEEEIRQLNNDNKLDHILESIKKANEQLEKESKYKQALDEIEGFIEVANGECRISEMEWNSIQDIINKAKDGE